MAFRVQVVIVETDPKGYVEHENKLAQMSEEFADREKAMNCFHDLSADLESMGRE